MSQLNMIYNKAIFDVITVLKIAEKDVQAKKESTKKMNKTQANRFDAIEQTLALVIESVKSLEKK